MRRRLLAELQASETARPTTSAGDVLRLMIARVAEVAEHHAMLFEFVGTIGAESIDTSPRVEEALRQVHAKRERSVRSDLDIECAAQLFLGMCGARCRSWSR